eukprot:CAMPEP_0174282240 /NCGR_PEP_ID=MMETSP0809-20121228/2695_1 /TAXON_ID=73025 ORGANISM="Eutreptiella gymnastica-like, Strain CCMP1594" /NCGR_SAMPLE_ID=MMETSP0809 /ASSEMBLY_ACC=CAM_ASM_000658 /LENGTH=242 /DNA_ID=CAMNT_0015376299 /DNA_START=1160 /DNA_END=1886 /DNA_ORIENTATION=+
MIGVGQYRSPVHSLEQQEAPQAFPEVAARRSLLSEVLENLGTPRVSLEGDGHPHRLVPDLEERVGEPTEHQRLGASGEEHPVEDPVQEGVAGKGDEEVPVQDERACLQMDDPLEVRQLRLHAGAPREPQPGQEVRPHVGPDHIEHRLELQPCGWGEHSEHQTFLQQVRCGLGDEVKFGRRRRGLRRLLEGDAAELAQTRLCSGGGQRAGPNDRKGSGPDWAHARLQHCGDAGGTEEGGSKKN